MKKMLILVLTFILVFQSNLFVFAAEQNIVENNSVSLFPFEYNGKWGYMDKNGVVKVKPIYDYAEQFSSGLALVRLENEKNNDYSKYGYLDKDGNVAIPIGLGNASSFVNGNAVVEIHNYIDNGTYWEKGTRYWINTNYKYIYKDDISNMEIFSDIFDSAYPFSNGLAMIDFSSQTANTKYIDTNGNTVIDNNNTEKYAFGRSFSEGLAETTYFMNSGSVDYFTSQVILKVGYINTKNELVISPKFDDAGSFSEGIAPVSINKKWGFINKKGEIVIPLLYDGAHSFNDGVAAIEKNGKYGFIDANNNVIISPQYENVGQCINGMIMVKNSEDEYLYYIDKSNNKIEAKLYSLSTK